MLPISATLCIMVTNYVPRYLANLPLSYSPLVGRWRCNHGKSPRLSQSVKLNAHKFVDKIASLIHNRN